MLNIYKYLIETMQFLIKLIMKGVLYLNPNWYYLHIIYIQISEVKRH